MLTTRGYHDLLANTHTITEIYIYIYICIQKSLLSLSGACFWRLGGGEYLFLSQQAQRLVQSGRMFDMLKLVFPKIRLPFLGSL